ncbi:MAG: hypothetical protein NC177_04990 [Ruminococcus flavefaciens]|nr:hypothetical protein [Ruminococcus flavefaciens]
MENIKNFKLIAMAVSAFLFVTASVSCGKSDEVITDSSPVAESTQAVTVASETTTTTAVTEQSTVATTVQTTTALTTAQATTTTVPPVTEEEGETAESDTDEVIISNEDAILIQDENNPYHFIIEGDFEIVSESPQSDKDYVSDTENYDFEVYEKLGIKVNLYGDNAQQAQQYYDACVEAYPNLPWTHSSNQVSIDISQVSNAAWELLEETSVEDVTAQLNDILSGRDYHDLSIEELYSIAGYCEVACRTDILLYFRDKTSKNFTFSGWTAL